MAKSARPPRLSQKHEAGRLEALERYGILDTETEELFDATVHLAASICSTSMASIGFIDDSRQWLKAQIGYPVSEVPRDLAFCAHTIQEEIGHLIIEDVSLDKRFSEHPFVAKNPFIKFYAGMSLITDDGYALGTLCVMDKEARVLTENQAEALNTLAAQVMTQLELRRSNKRLRLLEAAICQSTDAILITTAPFAKQPGGIINFANSAFVHMSGLAANDLIGKNVHDLPFLSPPNMETSITSIADDDGSYKHFVSISRDISERKAAEETKIRAEVLETTAVELENEITERIHAEEQLFYAASHDSLTDMWNRSYFIDQTERLFEDIKRKRVQNAAVMFLDLDRFKIINDSLGHVIGDSILVHTADRLQSILQDDGLIARLGGDEFTILLINFEDDATPQKLAQRLLDEFSKPFLISDREIYLSISIGIAFVSKRYQKAQDLLRDADAAMYRAKAQGKNRYEVFTQQLHDDAVALLKLENDLRRALDRNEFTVFYQPVISLGKGYIIGFEALVRWRHPTLGMIMPATFIALAEETGIIVSLGKFVLEQSIQQCLKWNKASLQQEPISVSVNVSARQLKQIDFSEQVLEALAQSGLPHACLKLEITESIIATEHSAFVTLQKLQKHGIQIHMDDFGTGYSSFSYLDKLPIQMLKIDRSFISNDNHAQIAKPDIVRAMISMAKTLGLSVTAEGVETTEQTQELHEMGCDHLQGYFFSKPMQASNTIAFVQNYMHAFEVNAPVTI